MLFTLQTISHSKLPTCCSYLIMHIFGGFQGMNYEPTNTILKIVFALSLKKMFVKPPQRTIQTLFYFATDSYTGHVGDHSYF